MAKIISSGKSDAGLKRSNNEDAFILKPEVGLFAVADGMGGAASGEVASRIFSDTAFEIFSQASIQSQEDAFSNIQKTFQLANDRILNKSHQEPRHRGMGCTAELLAFYNLNYVIGHVGDSRIYLFRQGQVRQITKDHSVVQEQIDQGLISRIEAKNHSMKHVILRAVGIDHTLAVDFIRGQSVPGDVFLLCSDGLTDMIDDLVIQQALSLPVGLEQKVDKLIDSAKAAGGHDNITVVLCEVES